MFPQAPQPKTMKQRMNLIVNPTTEAEKTLRDSYLTSVTIFFATTVSLVIWRTNISHYLDDISGI